MSDWLAYFVALLQWAFAFAVGALLLIVVLIIVAMAWDYVHQ